MTPQSRSVFFHLHVAYNTSRSQPPTIITAYYLTHSAPGIRRTCICKGSNTLALAGIGASIFSYGPVSVSVCHKSVFYRNGMKGIFWVLAWGLLSTSHTLCFKEIQLRVLPSGTYFLNSGLRQFCHNISIAERVINLARERWTLRA